MANQYKNKIVYNGTILLDLSGDTVTLPEHIMAGFVGHLADGTQVTGTGTGGGTPSATQHTILFEFTDETTQSITGYWDSSFISDAIRATIPTTVNGKTVASAQFDGVTWYEPADIPIGVQLINYNDVLTEYSISADGSINSSDLWNCVTDYTEIDSSMTFTFACSQYANIGFYDKNKNAIQTVVANNIKDSAEDYVAFGTLDSSIIPTGAAYIVMQGNSYTIEELSLIRTA